MTRTIAAAVFALLAFTATTHAATIQWDLSGVIGEPGVTVTGFFDYNTTTNSFPNYSFSVTGLCCASAAFFNPFTLTSSNSYILGASNDGANFYINGATSTNFEVITLGTESGSFDGTSGSVLVLSQSSVVARNAIGEGQALLQGQLVEAPVSPAPLPPALPLFATGILVLAGVAAVRKSRRSARI